MSRYINQDTETLTQGPWRGENIFDVADEDPEYLRGLLDGNIPDALDREIICRALGIDPNEQDN